MREFWRRTVWGMIALILIGTVTLTACTRRPAVVETASAAAPGVPAAATAAAPPSTSSASLSLTDADAIVAAQEQVLNRIYTKVLPSVVHIRVRQRVVQRVPQFDSPFAPFFGLPMPSVPQEFFREGEGSGFVWDDQGHIVTNNHVVANADRVVVVFADDTEAEATVLGTDPDSDLAVVKVDVPDGGLAPVTVGDSDVLKVGQLAVAIGNPFGQEFTMTSGIISALGRIIRSGNSPFANPEMIQTDAPINPGNSGGPLLDRLGRVIGINTLIISRSGASAGIGFAVPINTAKRVVPVLIHEGRYEYAWLGISGAKLIPEAIKLMDLPEDTHGVLVQTVTNDSPADKAGIRGGTRSLRINNQPYWIGGDVIVAINGTSVSDMDDLITYLIKNTSPGDKVTLAVLRPKGRKVQITVTLGNRTRFSEGRS